MKSLPAKLTEKLAVVRFTGKSMLPLFVPDDQLLVYFFNNSKESNVLETGDLVLFKKDEIWTAHRLVASDQTKGDRGIFVDPEKSQLWGRIDGVKRQNKTYFWGPSGMKFKKVTAALSLESGTFSKWKRWPALIFIWAIVKIDLFLHQVKESEAG